VLKADQRDALEMSSGYRQVMRDTLIEMGLGVGALVVYKPSIHDRERQGPVRNYLFMVTDMAWGMHDHITGDDAARVVQLTPMDKDDRFGPYKEFIPFPPPAGENADYWQADQLWKHTKIVGRLSADTVEKHIPWDWLEKDWDVYVHLKERFTDKKADCYWDNFYS